MQLFSVIIIQIVEGTNKHPQAGGEQFLLLGETHTFLSVLFQDFLGDNHGFFWCCVLALFLGEFGRGIERVKPF